MPKAVTDHRRATAERNIEAILDAAEALLARGAPATTSAVAAEAGVSRVTVYAHFPTREALLEAVVERVVAGATAAIKAADLGRGPALDALDRLIAVGWRQIERHLSVAQAVIEQLSPRALARTHRALHRPITALVRRGRAEGSFRDDLPEAWLVSSYFALMHACAEDVRAGKVAVDEAVGILQATLHSVFARPRGGRRKR